MSIHARIKQRRLALGIASHRALADMVGVSWQTVQLWEKEGGTAPNRNRIAKVATALETTPEWLQGGNPAFKNEDESAQENADTTIDQANSLGDIEGVVELLKLYAKASNTGKALIIKSARAAATVNANAAAGRATHKL